MFPFLRICNTRKTCRESFWSFYLRTRKTIINNYENTNLHSDPTLHTLQSSKVNICKCPNIVKWPCWINSNCSDIVPEPQSLLFLFVLQPHWYCHSWSSLAMLWLLLFEKNRKNQTETEIVVLLTTLNLSMNFCFCSSLFRKRPVSQDQWARTSNCTQQLTTTFCKHVILLLLSVLLLLLLSVLYATSIHHNRRYGTWMFKIS